MRSGRRLLSLVALLGVLAATTAVAIAAAGVSWGSAIEVPGTAALNVGGDAQVTSISCGGAVNCAAGGYVKDGSGHYRAFVVDETNGAWGGAIEMPGMAALDLGGYARVDSISCAGTGHCAAGGSYLDGSGNAQAFVVDETNGTWGSAIEVPGTAALNLGGNAQVTAVSCASAGNCAAGGFYSDGGGAFVVDETDGVWGSAEQVPHSAGLLANIGLTSISCTGVGKCAAVGGRFVADEKNGVWGRAHGVRVAGTAVNVGDLTSVSCTSPGNCIAGGSYHVPHHDRAVVVSEKNGVWGKASNVAGLKLANFSAWVSSVSCASPGNCAAGGARHPSPNNRLYAFVVAEKGGVWGKAVAVSIHGDAGYVVQSVSCASPGSCVAGGAYWDSLEYPQAFVKAETNGVWQKGIEVPGTAALGYDASVSSISCTTGGNCAVGGAYGVPGAGAGTFHAFVTSP
jgi:hypothetical protein